MIQCNGRHFLSFNHKDLVLTKRNKPACRKKGKTAKYCKSIADTFTVNHNVFCSFNLAGEMDVGYDANNMIICSVTQTVYLIRKAYIIWFLLCVFYISNFTKHSSITKDKFLNGNVRTLKPDKALVTSGRQFKSCSNSTFIMHGKD